MNKLLILLIFIIFSLGCGLQCPSGDKYISPEVEAILGEKWTKYVLNRSDEINYEQDIEYLGFAISFWCYESKDVMIYDRCYRKIDIRKDMPSPVDWNTALVLVHEAAHLDIMNDDCGHNQSEEYAYQKENEFLSERQ